MINIFILSAESTSASHEASWTGYSILAAFITWILLNMIAKIERMSFFILCTTFRVWHVAKP